VPQQHLPRIIRAKHHLKIQLIIGGERPLYKGSIRKVPFD
jgi:hypothetical protein